MEQKSEIVLYQPEGSVSLEVRLENETVWLTQQQISELFGTGRSEERRVGKDCRTRSSPNN